MPSALTHRRLSGLVTEQPVFPGAGMLGYRWPAEFEPQQAVWLTRPHLDSTWPGCMDQAQRQFDHFAAVLNRFVEVRLTQEAGIPTNDSWVRDYGPLFVVRDDAHDEGQGPPSLAMHDFIFNCWGGKYDDWQDDDVVPQRIADLIDAPVWVHNGVLEGGSIDTNGQGDLLTTESCLLNPNRNPHLSRDDIERVLRDTLNVQRIHWLPGGIEGDDTDGHVDDIARFVDANTIAAIRAPKAHPDHATLEANWQVLSDARNGQGEPFRLIELPVPTPISYDYPPNPKLFDGGGLMTLPASYANFLITNGAVLMPTFGQTADDDARDRLQRAMPEHEVIGVRADRLVVGRGALHCLSMQMPAV